MDKLAAQLKRLYLPADCAPGARLATDDGRTRAIVIAFDRQGGGDDPQHWTGLCAVANALQSDLALPAPAVSISGSNGFRLWLSLEEAAPLATAQHFVGLLGTAYFADLALVPAAALPPALNAATGLWAAFINPGLGASFADESGLDMAPPEAGQLALLEGLHSITAAQFAHALALLEPAPATSPPEPVAARSAPSTDGLLLKDATLEDIIAHLHRLHIEPTFRHLLK